MSALLRASTKVVTTGSTAIPDARKYLGCSLLGGSDAAQVKVYKGGTATPGNEIGFAVTTAAGLVDRDNPGFARDVDVGSAPHGSTPSGILVVVTGSAPSVCVYYST